MCFNSFIGSLRDLLGIERKTKKSKLQERAEDITFEDVKESAKQQPKIDELTRAKQLAKAAEEVCKGLFDKSPGLAMLAVWTFLLGARWADEHPASNYGSNPDWMSALRDELNCILTMVRDSEPKDVLFEMSISSLFIRGASWANDNPAPTF